MKIPAAPPEDSTVLAAFAGPPAAGARVGRLESAVSQLSSLGYLHWDELRRRPLPQGLSPEAAWGALRLSRLLSQVPVPLQDVRGAHFTFNLPAELSRLLQQTDVRVGFAVDTPDLLNSDQRDRYYVSSLIEESISSSQLEGAVTTTRVATQMLRSGRKPRDKSERMILNNYLAMKLIKPRVTEPLTPEFVLQLHQVLTEDTLDDPASAGRLRREDEEVVVGDAEGTVFHRPPSSTALKGRLDAMCRFANEDAAGKFIHPLIRAILLHFWLAYDHPFVDGNGRTARALFYWAGLHHGYWLLEFISISRIVLRSKGDYYRAFLYSETDHNDTTYFLLNQARVIDEAIRELRKWVASKAAEAKRFEALIRGMRSFNHRQQALLIHALKHPNAELTIQHHQRDHQVVYQTARTDLLGLESRGLLSRSTRGNTIIFGAVSDLAVRLDKA